MRQRYAAKTSVSPEKSRAEIEEMLRRYGADQFVSGWDGERKAAIQFRCNGRYVAFHLTLPDREEKRFRGTRRQWNRVTRNYETRQLSAAHEQEVRRCWRSLALVIKAKLEAVATGITTFEAEFLSHIVMPDGKTVGQHVGPQVAAAYATGQVRALLPEFTP